MNYRVKGITIARIPETLAQRAHSWKEGECNQCTRELADYINRKYSKYGFSLPRSSAIAYNPEWSPEGRSGERYRWVECPSDGLRKVGKASDIVRLNHTGWYTDNYQSETVHGEVWQLPADREGNCRFVPGVNDPCNDASVLDFRSITDDKEQCAWEADRMAEMYAERAREYQAKDEAERRLEEIGEEIQEEYQGFRRITKELRESCRSGAVTGVPVVKELVRKEWSRVKARILRLRAERTRIEENGMEYEY